MDKIFLVKACSANWFKHVPGSLDDETGDFYTKGSGWFVTDLEGMIDWCAAEGISALAVENFLSDRHDNYLSKARGFDHARRVCSYARSKGVKLWLVTPRRSDGLVYRELYDQPDGFDLLTPAHVRKELPDFTGIAFKDEPIDGGVSLDVKATGKDFIVEEIRSACVRAVSRGVDKAVLRVSPSPHFANVEFNYLAFVYFADDASRTFGGFVRDVMAPRLGGMDVAVKYVEWARLAAKPDAIPAAVCGIAQVVEKFTGDEVLGRWYSLAEYLSAVHFAARQREVFAI